jgi:hypothetical protein
MLGRVLRFALGVFVTLAAVPFVCRFGVLREIYPEVHAIAVRLPFVGGYYPLPGAGFDASLPPQLLAAAILGCGLTLIKLKTRR